MSVNNSNEFVDILIGASVVFGVNILVMFLLVTIPFIGLIQLLYVIPMAINYKRRQEIGKMKGIIIGAVITALLNGGCWLWILSGSH